MTHRITRTVWIATGLALCLPLYGCGPTQQEQIDSLGTHVENLTQRVYELEAFKQSEEYRLRRENPDNCYKTTWTGSILSYYEFMRIPCPETPIPPPSQGTD